MLVQVFEEHDGVGMCRLGVDLLSQCTAVLQERAAQMTAIMATARGWSVQLVGGCSDEAYNPPHYSPLQSYAALDRVIND